MTKWTLVAVACLGLSCCGCALFGDKKPPPTPQGVYYEPPVTIRQVPKGETPNSVPPTGWDTLEPKNIVAAIDKSIGQGPNEAIALDYYAQGDAYYRARQYIQAAEKYVAAADRWPDTTLEEDALFMAGESYFFGNHYSTADDEYGMLLKKYPNTRFTGVVMARQYAIGVYWVQCDHQHHRWVLAPNMFDRTQPYFDTFGYAVKEFDFVRINDPRNKLADEAVMNTANAYFLRGDYDDANYYYKLIRTEYPKSPHQKDAHLLGIQAELRRYQGPGYDERPLKEAEELIDQTLAQFGRDLGPERDRLVTAKEGIHAQLAQCDWSVAQYYEKVAHYAAAKVYYNDLVKEYPQTQLAQASRARLVAIDKLPDAPQDHFRWLAIAFDGKDPEADKDPDASSGNQNATAIASVPRNGGFIDGNVLGAREPGPRSANLGDPPQ